MTRLRTLLRGRGEGGSIAPAVPIIAFILLLLGGLGIDGSRQLNARGEAVAYAEEAARAGASGVDITAPDLQLSQPLVEQRIATYCRQVLALKQVTQCHFVPPLLPASASDPRLLRVRTYVATSIDTSLLSMVGVRTLAASAYAEARPYEGILKPGDESGAGSQSGG